MCIQCYDEQGLQTFSLFQVYFTKSLVCYILHAFIYRMQQKKELSRFHAISCLLPQTSIHYDSNIHNGVHDFWTHI